MLKDTYILDLLVTRSKVKSKVGLLTKFTTFKAFIFFTHVVDHAIEHKRKICKKKI